MFWSYTNDTTADFSMEFADRSLYQIKTTLTQEGRTISIETECDDYMDGLTNKINTMGMAISTYNAGQVNDIAPYDQCEETCSEATTKISNIKWSNNVAWTYVEDEEEEEEEEEDNNEPGELIIDDVAQSLDQCDAGCTECHEAHYENFPNDILYQCTDYTVYKYGNICTPDNQWDESKCMTSSTGFCHKSYPYGDPDKMKSPEAACRTIPSTHVDSTFEFGHRDCWSPTGGLCHYGCEGTCHNSWAEGDLLKWLSPNAMCRCMA
jgi:hypothetical protein